MCDSSRRSPACLTEKEATILGSLTLFPDDTLNTLTFGSLKATAGILPLLKLFHITVLLFPSDQPTLDTSLGTLELNGVMFYLSSSSLGTLKLNGVMFSPFQFIWSSRTHALVRKASLKWVNYSGIGWTMHIPYHLHASGMVEHWKVFLNDQFKSISDSPHPPWTTHMNKAVWSSCFSKLKFL